MSDRGENNRSDGRYRYSFKRLLELRRHLLVDMKQFQCVEVRQGLETVCEGGENRIHPVARDGDRHYAVDDDV